MPGKVVFRNSLDTQPSQQIAIAVPVGSASYTGRQPSFFTGDQSQHSLFDFNVARAEHVASISFRNQANIDATDLLGGGRGQIFDSIAGNPATVRVRLNHSGIAVGHRLAPDMKVNITGHSQATLNGSHVATLTLDQREVVSSSAAVGGVTTITTSTPHGYSPGDQVRFWEHADGGPVPSPLCDPPLKSIVATPTATTFTVNVSASYVPGTGGHVERADRFTIPINLATGGTGGEAVGLYLEYDPGRDTHPEARDAMKMWLPRNSMSSVGQPRGLLNRSQVGKLASCWDTNWPIEWRTIWPGTPRTWKAWQTRIDGIYFEHRTAFRTDGVEIATSSVANPTIITTENNHYFQTGDLVTITGHTSVTPNLDGTYVVTRINDTQFSIPINVTNGGVNGFAKDEYIIATTDVRNYGRTQEQLDLHGIISQDSFNPRGRGAGPFPVKYGKTTRYWQELAFDVPGDQFTEWNQDQLGGAVVGRSTIASSTPGASTTTITTNTAHGLSSGASRNRVTIAGHSDSACNGIFIATRLNATQFTIPIVASGGVGGTVTMHFNMASAWMSDVDRDPSRILYRVPFLHWPTFPIDYWQAEINTSSATWRTGDGHVYVWNWFTLLNFTLNEGDPTLFIKPIDDAIVAQAEYYVSTTGNDSNPGTLGQPFRTWAKARATANAGDTVMFRGGTYAETLNWVGGKSGLDDTRRITYKAYPGETVIVRPPAGSDRCLHMHGSSATATDAPCYLTFEGINFDGINGLVRDGVKVTAWDPTVNPAQAPAHHIRFVDCNVFNVQQGQGVLGTWGSVGCEWINGSIHDIDGPALGGANTQGLYWAASDFTIRGTEIYDCWGYGISNINSEAGLNVDNHLIEDLNVHHCGLTAPGVQELGGINVGEGTGIMRNNRVWACGAGPGIKLGFGSGSSGWKLLGNTVNACLRGFDIASGNNNAIVRNNIAKNCPGGNYVNVPVSTTQDHNSFDTTNPQWLNPAAGDFHLTASSPASIVGAGIAQADLTVDADGVSRGNPPDIGAYER